jgi:hypothetical protein
MDLVAAAATLTVLLAQAEFTVETVDQLQILPLTLVVAQVVVELAE